MSWISDVADAVGIKEAFKLAADWQTQRQAQTMQRLQNQSAELQNQTAIMAQQMQAMNQAAMLQANGQIANAQAGAVINFERMKPWLVMAAIAGIAYVVVKG